MRASTSSVPSLRSAPAMASTEPCTSPLTTQRELLAAGLLELLHHLLERARGAGRAQRLATLAHAVVGDLARAALALDHGERIAGLGRGVEAQDLDRHRRPGLRHRLAAIVDERAHAPPGRTGDDDVADAQRAALHQHGADRTATALELGLDDDAVGRAVRIGLAGPAARPAGWIASSSLSRPVRFRAETSTSSVSPDMLSTTISCCSRAGAHAVGIGARLVDLVDGHDHRHAGGLGVIDGLHRLRHDAVVGGDHQHHDVGHLGAARAHGGERLVARRIDERDLLAVGRRHLIGADVLRDAAGLAGRQRWSGGWRRAARSCRGRRGP